MPIRIVVLFTVFPAVFGILVGVSLVTPLETQITTHDKSEQYKTANTESQSENAALARYTYWLTIFTAVLALATIGLVLATYLLWKAGERQFRLTRRIATNQAAQTGKQLHLAEITAQRQLRAYIVVRRCVLDFEVAQPVATLTVTNAGQTPAEKLMIDGILYPASAPGAVMVASFEGDLSKARVGSGRKVSLPIRAKNPLTGNELAALRDGKMMLIAIGDIEYTDIFGTTWVQPYEFCIGGKYGRFRAGGMAVSTNYRPERKKHNS